MHREQMSKQQDRLSSFAFLIAGSSFIPGYGILFGIIAILWGLITEKIGGKKIAIIGASGIVFSIFLYVLQSYFGFVKKEIDYDNNNYLLSKNILTFLVKSIEFYKSESGHYPESLAALHKTLPENEKPIIYDPANVGREGNLGYYHYELTGHKQYFVLGVGSDG